MDVVLGVAVAGRVARLAMVGSPASGGQLLDQYALDLSDDAMAELADTIIGTYREVTESGNRVAATRLCLPDPSAADTLRQRVAAAGVQNVEVVAEAEAAAALARSAGADAALLLADDDTVSLTVVGEDEQSTSTLASVPIGAAGAAVACASVLQHMPAAATPMRVMLVGQRLDLDSVAAELRSTAPVEVAPDAGYAIARGAAQTADGSGFAPAGASTQMAPALDATQMAPVGDATQMAPAAGDATQLAPAAGDATQMAPAGARTEGAVGPDLAYSQEAGEGPWADEMPMEPLGEFVPEQEDEAEYTTVIAPPAPRMLLMGSAVMFLVISFATLAVTVAINVRPTADVAAQPAPPTQANTVPGRYLPPVPHQADPVALPVSVLTPPPAAPVVPNVRSNDQPVQVPSNPVPAAPQPAPAPPPVEVPPAPVPVPIPAPIPVPIPVPPLVPPWTPPWTFPTTPTTPPTTTTTAPTTTTTPPTTTTTPPTTTTTVPTTTTTVPSTSTPTEPSTPTHTVTTTSAAPVTPKDEPTYTAPSTPAYTAPAYTPPAQQPTHEAPQTTVYQQEPAYGGGSSGSSGSGSSGSSGGSSGGGSSSGGGHSGESPVTTVPVSP
ncbi:hypothetical protein A5784_14340 [Mycobacterium sp. 852013-50091_SCH5140682]|uniref:hypothetical protein n=1 Tax=Mycobacterium sp. 852013-50091_SCH5140682 TaxID=1834109 RepID=UPI0007EB50A0|nr:hypothetical protein [Mycobacterium sp. 852013-50091_SCH5140682]OBC03403.1 hypothetical protein A5784_14340 [Mycobacterium sp. 852013-50091_SCH5140682]